MGELSFGALPHNVTRSELIEVPLNNTRRGAGDELWDFYMSNGWQVGVRNVSMTTSFREEELLPVLEDFRHIAVISTSYPYIGLPLKAVCKAEALMGLADRHTWVDCATRSSLPDLVFDFGPRKRITLTPTDYLLEVWDEIYKKRKCVSTFDSMDGDGAILLGSPFLNGLISVFDAGRESVWFGKRE
ncbi:acid protease [Ophiobolus disseminans]|uniref:Acid protease n=1 Tax=Ophiobolus disseminans TaxID=1469910 RepID=A0A6A6ZQE6_9PLEO|nr:acid protease [Ophiobolus disseminans]